jgi:hypothetical protein
MSLLCITYLSDGVAAQCESWRRRQSRHSDISGSSVPNLLGDNVTNIFPCTLTFENEMQIIHEWQEVMSSGKQSRSPCVVCAQQFHEFTLQVDPRLTILDLLRNPYLPDYNLPNSYNIELYRHTILYSKGMCSTASIAPLQLCHQCQRSLCAEKPVRPRNSLANFQYYGRERLPNLTRRAFNEASPFDLMLIARCRASTITHHYCSKGMRGGRIPEDTSQHYNRGNVAVLLQDSSHLRTVLPPSVDEMRDAMCVVSPGGGGGGGV